MNKLKQEVGITGCGWVTPFAAGGISEVLSAGAQAGAASTGRVPDEFLESCEFASPEVRQDKSVLMAAVGIQHALSNAGLTREDIPPERLGLVIGCAQAGQLGMIRFANEVREQSPRFVSPLHFPQTVGNYVAGALARALHVRGPNLTVACGVASGLAAIWEAANLVGSDKADVMLAGGVDQLLFDTGADGAGEGCLAAEGACLFVVESVKSAEARGAARLARIGGIREVDEPFGAFTQAHAAQCSAAGLHIEGAVNIEGWVGACEAALGAGAVASLIGASRGCTVPRAEKAKNPVPGPEMADSPTATGADRELSWIIASSTGKSALALALEI